MSSRLRTAAIITLFLSIVTWENTNAAWKPPRSLIKTSTRFLTSVIPSEKGLVDNPFAQTVIQRILVPATIIWQNGFLNPLENIPTILLKKDLPPTIKVFSALKFGTKELEFSSLETNEAIKIATNGIIDAITMVSAKFPSDEDKLISAYLVTLRMLFAIQYWTFSVTWKNPGFLKSYYLKASETENDGACFTGLLRITELINDATNPEIISKTVQNPEASELIRKLNEVIAEIVEEARLSERPDIPVFKIISTIFEEFERTFAAFFLNPKVSENPAFKELFRSYLKLAVRFGYLSSEEAVKHESEKGTYIWMIMNMRPHLNLEKMIGVEGEWS